ncbi:MAG: hypothetical protein A2898_02210 [Candidatus Kerfeldbacteria bacterium RIFCSPLOWO2_01_FULL_48_11]|uniref:BIG2 domain-containing protein n=1 Tax=Candidatus Kerfeldbacteria bacterium RIFCSPLOWO2_01_FULL_48_11 TaxID=1798543 RepID=A0A1G2B1L2_9BACT|nr:MAG: hypothetical protein UY52_C0005G0008 [Parcubacteria group bacterium GW2011_GWC2_49_9]OGY83072.1 MAG: hypothetical protein A2898_02210 [Candidatus Kerfeldbacteria bacterium RIFCSPLOWO2_01_FULL_48_11]
MTRIATTGGRLLIGVVLCAALAVAVHAQAATLQITAPLDSQMTVDQTYRHQLVLQGVDDTVEAVFSLTSAPAGMTMSTDGVLAWSPSVPGDYRVVAGVRNGDMYNSAAFRITVVPGAVAKIDITPNAKPTILQNGSTMQFVARAFDAKGNIVSNDRYAWTTSGDIGTISETGLFASKRSTTGEVIATFGSMRASVGVVVTGTPTAPLAPQQQGQVLGESTQIAQGDGATPTNEAAPDISSDDQQLAQANTTGDQANVCTNWPQWILIVILIAYGAVLIWYYGFAKRRGGPLWWLFPILLTLVGLVIYSRYICESTYLWWPWVLVIVGVILTVVYQPRTRQPQ